MLLSFLPCLFKYPKRIKRDPFAGLIAPLNGPGAGDRAAHLSPLVILAIQHQFEQRRKPRVAGIAMSSKCL